MENEEKYLSDLEKEKIIAFNSDEVMVEAVKKVILATLYRSGTLKEGVKSSPLKNGALSLAFQALGGRGVVSDADLGADLRAMASGLNMLESGFTELSKIKREEGIPSPLDVNEAI